MTHKQALECLDQLLTLLDPQMSPAVHIRLIDLYQKMTQPDPAPTHITIGDDFKCTEILA